MLYYLTRLAMKLCMCLDKEVKLGNATPSMNNVSLGNEQS